MRKYLLPLVFLLTFSFTGCKTWDITQLKVPNAPLNPKLPALEQSAQGIISVTAYQDKQEVFNNEVEQNLTNPYGEKYGYIRLTTNAGYLKLGLGYTVVSGISLFTLNLLGLPFSRTKLQLEATIEILNSKRELIGKYRAISKGKAISALYYGYALTNTFRKAYADALKNALDEIRPQIQADAERLNSELQNAGKINR